MERTEKFWDQVGLPEMGDAWSLARRASHRLVNYIDKHQADVSVEVDDYLGTGVFRSVAEAETFTRTQDRPAKRIMLHVKSRASTRDSVIVVIDELYERPTLTVQVWSSDEGYAIGLGQLLRDELMTIARSEPTRSSGPMATTRSESQPVGAVQKERPWYENPWLVGVFVTAIGTIIAVLVLSQFGL